MQYLSRTALTSVAEEVDEETGGTGTFCPDNWALDHATAIQPQVTSAKTVGRPFMAVRACVPDGGLCPIRRPEVNGRRPRVDAEIAMISAQGPMAASSRSPRSASVRLAGPPSGAGRSAGRS